ncbi:hypothetical protein JXB11_01860 [Candidatus Woesearchaeota archaeon]|nr:hypothetical protein [Candidatus Woesearchaeota archaeon]
MSLDKKVETSEPARIEGVQEGETAEAILKKIKEQNGDELCRMAANISGKFYAAAKADALKVLAAWLPRIVAYYNLRGSSGLRTPTYDLQMLYFDLDELSQKKVPLTLRQLDSHLDRLCNPVLPEAVLFQRFRGGESIIYGSSKGDSEGGD